MDYKGKALFNVLRTNSLVDPSFSVQAWQVIDYRNYQDEDIFRELEECGYILDKETFLLYSEECDSPEEFVDCIYLEDNLEKYDRIYLLMFEAWRRFLPNKRSVSIFCDELDYAIDLYEQKDDATDENLLVLLDELEDILDDNTSDGVSASDAFTYLTDYSCHDIEGFLYDFIKTQINQGSDVIAAELIDGFYEYLLEPIWFDLLKVKTTLLTSPDEASLLLARFIEALNESQDAEIHLEFLRFMLDMGDYKQFHQSFKHAKGLIQTEDEFQELLTILLDYFTGRSKANEESAIKSLLEVRAGRDLDAEIGVGDSALEIINDLMIASSPS